MHRRLRSLAFLIPALALAGALTFTSAPEDEVTNAAGCVVPHLCPAW
ncbi:hypothetical protein ACFV2D_35965 [Streptomyces capillispiralis]